MTTATTQWNVSGEYIETCSCDFLCPCLPSNLAGKQTNGDCYFAMVFHVDRGRYGTTSLDGLNFAVIGRAPGPSMADGNISVGVITDERATAEQAEALVQIASGQAGGPMAALGPLVGQFLGTESGGFDIQGNGMKRSVTIGGLVNQALEGVPGANENEPLYLENTNHPASARVALAKASGSHLHALGLNWDDDSGNNNGHFAPFNWSAS